MMAVGTSQPNERWGRSESNRSDSRGEVERQHFRAWEQNRIAKRILEREIVRHLRIVGIQF
jgi:hypothetical protein